MAYRNFKLQGRPRGSNDPNWLALLDRDTGSNELPVRARSVKEALSKVHRDNAYLLIFQPSIELRLLDESYKVVATQSQYDATAEVTTLMLSPVEG